MLEREALNNNGSRFRQKKNPVFFLTSTAEVSGEHRGSRLEILFSLSSGNSANQLQSVTAFMNSVEEENVMDIPLEISLQALNIQAVNRYPIGRGKIEFLTLTFKVTFYVFIYLITKDRIVVG